MAKKVVIGLSGGVDSSVAAHLLKEQGWDVTALFMINWHDTTGLLEGDCPSNDDEIFARLVAKKLAIPFHVVDLSEQYKQRVIDYMFDEYSKGKTPNPDVLCNREIKFDVFMDAALKYNADYVATGHYCQKGQLSPEGPFQLLAGADKNKDQSYFLCQLNQQQLSKALFPIGHLQKPEVRKIAAELNLPTATRKDSQGICFVGKVDLPTFLQQQLARKEGDIIEIQKDAWFYGKRKDMVFDVPNPDDYDLGKIVRPYFYRPDNGTFVGRHQGAHFYTVGQRKGLNVGGKAEPLYVLATDTTNNVVYVGQGHDHPGLNRRALFIPSHEVHWIRPDLAIPIGDEQCYSVRIRYRQDLQEARIFSRATGLYILFKEIQRGITPGQFAAWYQGEELCGSGTIN
jgi:tRNA-uridine 2-sulfurtransferase